MRRLCGDGWNTMSSRNTPTKSRVLHRQTHTEHLNNEDLSNPIRTLAFPKQAFLMEKPIVALCHNVAQVSAMLSQDSLHVQGPDRTDICSGSTEQACHHSHAQSDEGEPD